MTLDFILLSDAWFLLIPLLIMFYLITWLRCCMPDFYTIFSLQLPVLGKVLWDYMYSFYSSNFSFIHSFIFIWAYGFLFYLVNWNLLLSLFILMFILSWAWTVGASYNYLLGPFDISIILWTFLTFSYNNIYQDYLVFSLN